MIFELSLEGWGGVWQLKSSGIPGRGKGQWEGARAFKACILFWGRCWRSAPRKVELVDRREVSGVEAVKEIRGTRRSLNSSTGLISFNCLCQGEEIMLFWMLGVEFHSGRYACLKTSFNGPFWIWLETLCALSKWTGCVKKGEPCGEGVERSAGSWGVERASGGEAFTAAEKSGGVCPLSCL